MSDIATLEERLNRIEGPALAAEREAELARLQAEAAVAQHRLAEIAAELEILARERKALAPRITEAESAWNALRAEDARLAVGETSLQRRQGLAWRAIRAAETAGRPAVASVPERRPSTVADVRDRVVAWFKAWRDRAKAPAPAMRPDQYLAAKVRILSACVAGGEGRAAGWVGLVPDSEVDILTANGRAVCIERRIIAERPTPAVAMARAVRGTRGPGGESLTPGDTIPVDAATRDAIRDGRLTAFELIGPDVEAERRVADLERRRLELEARFPQ